MTLRDPASARRSHARLLRAHLRGEIDEKTMRALNNGFTVQLGYFRLEAEVRIEGKLDAVLDRQAEGKR